MGAVVRDGLSKLPDSDIHALAVYFADIGNAESRSAETEIAINRATNADRLDLEQVNDDGARLYVSACGACHYNSSGASGPNRPELAFVSSLNAPDPTAFVQTVLRGHRADMPAFGLGLSDADIAAIASYLRKTRTSSAPWPRLAERVGQIRDAARAPASSVP